MFRNEKEEKETVKEAEKKCPVRKEEYQETVVS